ncbi:hypothetical protein GOP47_0010189 [Adiantum capillus-veneris]|uniref:Uncharacterized protein n=1 Tax=Adiantum capillus-veneris TaxID=13818 RepID=A0A9D4ZG35_ADICA|nr:hypothetical protein GOP47_0010189 [Adiantum capillus-veneris]
MCCRQVRTNSQVVDPTCDPATSLTHPPEIFLGLEAPNRFLQKPRSLSSTHVQKRASKGVWAMIEDCFYTLIKVDGCVRTHTERRSTIVRCCIPRGQPCSCFERIAQFIKKKYALDGPRLPLCKPPPPTPKHLCPASFIASLHKLCLPPAFSHAFFVIQWEVDILS